MKLYFCTIYRWIVHELIPYLLIALPNPRNVDVSRSTFLLLLRTQSEIHFKQNLDPLKMLKNYSNFLVAFTVFRSWQISTIIPSLPYFYLLPVPGFRGRWERKTWELANCARTATRDDKRHHNNSEKWNYCLASKGQREGGWGGGGLTTAITTCTTLAVLRVLEVAAECGTQSERSELGEGTGAGAGDWHRCHGHVPLLLVTTAVARTNGPNSGHVFHVATAPQQLSNKPEKWRTAAARTGAQQLEGVAFRPRYSPLIIVFLRCVEQCKKCG